MTLAGGPARAGKLAPPRAVPQRQQPPRLRPFAVFSCRYPRFVPFSAISAISAVPRRSPWPRLTAGRRPLFIAVRKVYTHGRRLKNVRYPNGRGVHYRYGAEGGRDDMISRLATTHDNSSGLAGRDALDPSGYGCPLNPGHREHGT